MSFGAILIFVLFCAPMIGEPWPMAGLILGAIGLGGLTLYLACSLVSIFKRKIIALIALLAFTCAPLTGVL